VLKNKMLGSIQIGSRRADRLETPMATATSSRLPPAPPPWIMAELRRRVSGRDLEAMEAMFALRMTAQQVDNALTEWIAGAAGSPGTAEEKTGAVQEEIDQEEPATGEGDALDRRRDCGLEVVHGILDQRAIEILEEYDQATEEARFHERLLLLDQATIAPDVLPHAAGLVADQAFVVPRHQGKCAGTVVAGTGGVLVEMHGDQRELVDGTAEPLPVLLRELRHLRGDQAGEQRQDERDGPKEHPASEASGRFSCTDDSKLK